MATAHEQILKLLPQLTEAELLSLMVQVIQGGPNSPLVSDAFIDSLDPVERAFCAAYDKLDYLTNGDALLDAPEPDDRFWRESTYAINAGLGEAA